MIWKKLNISKSTEDKTELFSPFSTTLKCPFVFYLRSDLEILNHGVFYFFSNGMDYNCLIGKCRL